MNWNESYDGEDGGICLSNNNNNINSLNGLDVNTLNALLSSGVNANQIAALVGSSFNSQQISALLLNNNGNINSLGGQDVQLQQLLSDLGNGNIATGATNMANLLLQATSNNPTIANDLNNLLAAQGLIANGQNVNGGASVTVISSSSRVLRSLIAKALLPPPYLLLPLRLVDCLLVSLEPTWGHELEKRGRCIEEAKGYAGFLEYCGLWPNKS
jgi:hypothetical protein